MRVLFLAVALAATAFAGSAAQAESPDCRPAQLKLVFDGENGNFDGMSHTGTALLLTNHSNQACVLPARPVLHFTGRHGGTVNFELEVPRFMHPGPVLVPITLEPGATAMTSLRWVNGDPYGDNHCIDVKAMKLDLGDSRFIEMPFKVHTCSAKGTPATYEMPVLKIQTAAAAAQ